MPEHIPLRPELQAYRTQFEAIKHEAQDLTQDLTEIQLNWHPAPGQWSVAQCLNHLNVLGYLMAPRLEAAVERARAAGVLSEGPFRYTFLDRLFIRGNAPTVRRRLKTPRVYRPAAASLAFDAVVPPFLALQDRLIACVESSDGIDLRRVKVASAASRLLRISLGAWFASTVAHEQRHLAQARRVREALGFPASHIEG